MITEKGRGYEPARLKPEKFHGVSPFDVATGKTFGTSKTTYTEVFSRKICDMAKKDDKIVAITASMASGTGLARFQKYFPLRFFMSPSVYQIWLQISFSFPDWMRRTEKLCLNRLTSESLGKM